jgi:hypothetical protein
MKLAGLHFFADAKIGLRDLRSVTADRQDFMAMTPPAAMDW